MEIASLAFMGNLIWKFVDFLKTIYSQKRIQWPLVIALILGVVTGVLFKMDLLTPLGIVTDYPLVSYIYTGVALGAFGASISDIFNMIPKKTN